MTGKGKIMGDLGTADGAVLRCIDILQGIRPRDLIAEDLSEIMAKLNRAHEAICRVAHELEKEIAA